MADKKVLGHPKFKASLYELYKKVTKSDKEGRRCNLKIDVTHSKFFCARFFLKLNFSSSVSHEALINLQFPNYSERQQIQIQSLYVRDSYITRSKE